MPQPPYALVENLSTRQLMSLLRRTYRTNGWYSPIDGNSPFGYTTEEIKAELATREHVPNKAEGRALRRQAAQGHG